jgi:MOSC domain-containing protein YiiM
VKNKILGKITNLFISKKGFINRIKQNELVVDTNGVLSDKYYGSGTARSVLITSLNSYELANNNEINILFGQLGENLLVDFDLNVLKPGVLLKSGEVILEITQKCTICNSLSKIDEKLPKLLESDRGVFAKVVKSGTIKENNTLNLIDNNE